MDLRPSPSKIEKIFSGFNKAEVAKMENALSSELKEQSPDDEYCKKLARLFNRSSGRAGKPVVKWTEVQSWFKKNQENSISKETSFDAGDRVPAVPKSCTSNKENEDLKLTEGEKDQDLSKLEFEARSSKDGAWYDVDTFLSHRFLDSGDTEVRVRYMGFGSDEDEWVSISNVRERSIPLEHSECQKIKAGDLVVCFLEREDQARYYDAHVTDIQRRLHDIRGCRCLFSIRYDFDNTEEKVRLRRLCCRPGIIAQSSVVEEMILSTKYNSSVAE